MQRNSFLLQLSSRGCILLTAAWTAGRESRAPGSSSAAAEAGDRGSLPAFFFFVAQVQAEGRQRGREGERGKKQGLFLESGFRERRRRGPEREKRGRGIQQHCVKRERGRGRGGAENKQTHINWTTCSRATHTHTHSLDYCTCEEPELKFSLLFHQPALRSRVVGREQNNVTINRSKVSNLWSSFAALNKREFSTLVCLHRLTVNNEFNNPALKYLFISVDFFLEVYLGSTFAK